MNYGEGPLEEVLAAADKLGGRIGYDAIADPTQSHLFLGSDYKRRILIIFPPIAGNVTFSNDTPVVAGNGIRLLNTSPSVTLRLEDVGDMIRKPIYCIGSTATSFCGYIVADEPTECYKGTPRTKGVLGPWQGHS